MFNIFFNVYTQEARGKRQEANVRRRALAHDHVYTQEDQILLIHSSPYA